MGKKKAAAPSPAEPSGLLSREQRLRGFVDWCATHLTGDEKGEAHLFLDRFLQAFHQKGLKECGGTAEFRIKKSAEDGGGTSFADFVWKPLVLIEMKKRGADLARHYQQAFKYWERLTPGRPRYVILSNFDEFWVYDFDIQIEEPLDKLRLEELPERWGPLSFLFPVPEPPKFKNNQEVTHRWSTTASTPSELLRTPFMITPILVSASREMTSHPSTWIVDVVPLAANEYAWQEAKCYTVKESS